MTAKKAVLIGERPRAVDILGRPVKLNTPSHPSGDANTHTTYPGGTQPVGRRGLSMPDASQRASTRAEKSAGP